MSDEFTTLCWIERDALYYLAFDQLLAESPIRDGAVHTSEAHVVERPEIREALLRGEGEMVTLRRHEPTPLDR